MRPSSPQPEPSEWPIQPLPCYPYVPGQGELVAQLWLDGADRRCRYRYSIVDTGGDSYRLFEDTFDPVRRTPGFPDAVLGWGRLVGTTNGSGLCAAWHRQVLGNTKHAHSPNRKTGGVFALGCVQATDYSRYNQMRPSFGGWLVPGSDLPVETFTLSRTEKQGVPGFKLHGMPAELAQWVRSGEWQKSFDAPLSSVEIEF